MVVCVLEVFSVRFVVTEFGVFVDKCGRRSRKHNIRWTGLPLAFSK